MTAPSRSGVSLLELLLVLVVLGVLVGLAAPPMGERVRRMRVRAALDQLSTDLYRARALAAARGIRVAVRFLPPTGCAEAYVVARAEDGVLIDSVSLARRAPGVCLSANVARAMSIDSRGMLIGSPRTIRARMGEQADSATVSIAGRVYRWY